MKSTQTEVAILEALDPMTIFRVLTPIKLDLQTMTETQCLHQFHQLKFRARANRATDLYWLSLKRENNNKKVYHSYPRIAT